MENFTEEIPKYGDKFTLEQWLDYCDDGWFTDYDGFAQASNGTLCTKKWYYPSEIDKLPEGTTHIIWFNK